MNPAIAQLAAAFERALATTLPEQAGAAPLLAPTNNPKFGDYQANGVLPLAKRLGQPPRPLAEEIAQALAADAELAAIAEPPTVAGPGFINFSLKADYWLGQLRAVAQDPRLGIAPTPAPQKIVVDYSSPNIAKEMHVGHLRSTILGDAIARILEFLGHEVLRLNHVGDWGTQFGMLIGHLGDRYPEALATADALDLGDLVTFYQQAKQRFDQDEEFKTRSRQNVVALQGGDAASRRAWQLLCDQSRREFAKIYDLLGIDPRLSERGESFYNDFLPQVVADLQQLGLVTENQGAQCVFLEGFRNKDGDPLPLIVQKSDGGYNYATTDLAALRYRLDRDGAERLIYVTDASQADHFSQVFQVARRAGWVPATAELVHVPFGLVQGEDGKKLKTRSGDTPKLKDLLTEAIDRARQDLVDRLAADERQETPEFIAQVAHAIGLGAVKYADLSQNRSSNYVFSYDKMLALTGNTAPYLLYAYARIQSIARRGEVDFASLASADLTLSEPAEFALAKHLLRFDEILAAIADDLLPNRLCEYLYDTSKLFNQFFERCPVLQSAEPVRSSRLALCDLTGRTLALGLRLLGIEPLDRM